MKEKKTNSVKSFIQKYHVGEIAAFAGGAAVGAVVMRHFTVIPDKNVVSSFIRGKVCERHGESGIALHMYDVLKNGKEVWKTGMFLDREAAEEFAENLAKGITKISGGLNE